MTDNRISRILNQGDIVATSLGTIIYADGLFTEGEQEPEPEPEPEPESETQDEEAETTEEPQSSDAADNYEGNDPELIPVGQQGGCTCSQGGSIGLSWLLVGIYGLGLRIRRRWFK